ncbi:hypothetical protein [Nocardia phage NBR1]|uniref:hypothetical protein n=1 Tax=Nocardia phage NBR1 TaxID=1109711 RepID=UPI00023EEDE4|nr:hypothetical protein NoPhNBR1_gp33 [Nocardia phage NBR1]AEV52246.1 hypothetical protein [Nocardia phage NBR1]
MEQINVGGRTFGLELINDGNNLAVVEVLADGSAVGIGTMFVGVLEPAPAKVYVEPDETVTESEQHADT